MPISFATPKFVFRKLVVLITASWESAKRKFENYYGIRRCYKSIFKIFVVLFSIKNFDESFLFAAGAMTIKQVFSIW